MSEQEMIEQTKQPHSRLGIASFIISVVNGILLFITVVIAGLIQKDKKKIFAILGVIFSLFAILGIFGLVIIGISV
jgi:uncharacterized membrane protein